MHISICLGLGAGDEGKGATVNALCTDPKSTIVVRFSGGHQCGHTVVHDGFRHIFSNFGSGTLKGVPTYWSEFCTVDPVGVMNEGNLLRENGYKPAIHYNANAMVTTPYDIYKNVHDSENMKHGTVGVGFGATIQRNEDHYHLFVRDLKYPHVRDEKLRLISQYYRLHEQNIREPLEKFKMACDDLTKRYEIVDDLSHITRWNHNLIFEGGQGILLDQRYGFFPHVTRSNTTSKNAIQLLYKYNLHTQVINTYYITRAYQTRHGNGYLSNEHMPTDYIKINPLETNVDTGAQGKFRRGVLDLDVLKYAISCDKQHNISLKDYLVMTCLDHIPPLVPVTQTGVTGTTELSLMHPLDIAKKLNLKLITTNSDTHEDTK